MKKISWGTGIAIGIIIFIVLSVTMTIIFMTQDVSLVSDNYYEKSLVYQDEIDKQSRTKSLNEEVRINFNGEMISILFPLDYVSESMNGEIYFYLIRKWILKFHCRLVKTASKSFPLRDLKRVFGG